MCGKGTWGLAVWRLAGGWLAIPHVHRWDPELLYCVIFCETSGERAMQRKRARAGAGAPGASGIVLSAGVAVCWSNIGHPCPCPRPVATPVPAPDLPVAASVPNAPLPLVGNGCRYQLLKPPLMSLCALRLTVVKTVQVTDVILER